jgi:hypothetical protein
MGKSAAMVQAKVVKGGGAGIGKGKLDCDAICAAFDPPIEFGTHSEMVGSLDNYQAEHIIPTSSFHEMGRGGDRVSGCSGYSTSGALTWMARDGQSANQEHKILTDQMRLFSQSNDLAGRQATLNEWLDEYKKGAKEALKKAIPKRDIKDKSLDEDELIEQAAECIKQKAAESFSKTKPPVKGDTKLRNPWKATDEQRRAAPAVAPGRAARGGRR